MFGGDVVIVRWARAIPIDVWFWVCARLTINRARARIGGPAITVATVDPPDNYRFVVDNSWPSWSTVDTVANDAAVVIW